jgi:hypothetical protein
MTPAFLDITLENLARQAIKAKWKKNPTNGLDGQLEVQTGTDRILLNAEIKQELRNHQLDQIFTLAKQNPPFIIIAKRLFPEIKEILRKKGIAYLEENGNIFLKYKKTLLWLNGNKQTPLKKEKAGRAFGKTGLKVIFHFLIDENLINQPYRQIARITKVALGTINYVIEGLKENGFLIRRTKDRYELLDRKQLLEKWLPLYAEKLKPTLLVGKFRFLKTEDFANWKNVQLRNKKTCWGGEAAGNLLTNYLRPAILTMYTLETRQELIRNYRLIPDEQGDVQVYKKFWEINPINANVAPPLLVYADLMNTGEERCIETAQKLYHDVLETKL